MSLKSSMNKAGDYSLHTHLKFGLIIQALNIISVLGTSVLLAQLLGLYNFGIYTLLYAIMMIFSVVAAFGIPTYLTRSLAAARSDENDQEMAQVLGFSIKFGALTSVSAAFVCGIIIYIYFGQDQVLTLLAVSFVLIRTIADFLSGILAGLGKVTASQFTIITLVNTGAVLLIVILAVLSTAFSVQLAIFAHFLSALFALTFAFLTLSKSLAKPTQFKTPDNTLRQRVGECGSIFLINGLAAVQVNFLFVLLGWLSNPESVSIFRIAERISGLCKFFKFALDRVVGPRLTTFWSKGQKTEIRNLLRKISLVNSMFHVAFILGLILFGEYAINYVFGLEFEASLWPAILITGASLIVSPLGFNGLLLTMTGFANRVYRILLIAIPLQYLTAFLLVPNLGITGAAIASSIFIIFTALGLSLAARKHTSITILGK